MSKIKKPRASIDPRTIIPAQYILDPRLGRRYEADPRNANFPVRAMLPRAAYEKPRSKTWDCKIVLDQGSEGSCVGHGFAHDLIASPYPLRRIAKPDAVKIYKVAQTLDDWPGSAYSGTSVLAGAKATMQLHPGSMESYRWATTIQDVIATLGYHGPVVFGTNWYSSMYNVDSEGYISVAGTIAGGHCFLIRGVDIVNMRLLMQNSWGTSWGQGGMAWIRFEDFSRLLSENGDCCVPVNRKYWRTL